MQIVDVSEFDKIESELVNHDRLKSVGAKVIKKRAGLLTIRRPDTNIAGGVDQFMTEKYGEKCKVNIPRPYVPTIKITGLNDTTSPFQEILQQIINHNPTITPDFEFVREYQINITRNPYRNIIARCSLDFLKRATTRQVLLNGTIEYFVTMSKSIQFNALTVMLSDICRVNARTRLLVEIVQASICQQIVTQRNLNVPIVPRKDARVSIGHHQRHVQPGSIASMAL